MGECCKIWILNLRMMSSAAAAMWRYPLACSRKPPFNKVLCKVLHIKDWCSSILNAPTYFYTLLWTMQASSYWCSIVLWISPGFTPSDKKKIWWLLAAPSTVQTDKYTTILYTLPFQLGTPRHLMGSVNIFSKKELFLQWSLKYLRYF